MPTGYGGFWTGNQGCCLRTVESDGKEAGRVRQDTKQIYENGERTLEVGKYITGDDSPDLGKFVNFEEQPKDPAALRGVLWDEKYSGDRFDCGNIKEHIKKLSGKGKEKKLKQLTGEEFAGLLFSTVNLF